ncbi:hypothetical protein LCGC14_2749240, partial [marine sediment metagenome]
MALSSGVTRRITRGADGREVRAPLGGRTQGLAAGLSQPGGQIQSGGGLTADPNQFRGGPPPPNSQGRITAGLGGAQQGTPTAGGLGSLPGFAPGSVNFSKAGGPPPPNSMGIRTAGGLPQRFGPG